MTKHNLPAGVDMKFIDQLKILYPESLFPRQFCKHERLPVKNFEELIKFLNMYNGICNCGATLYNYPSENLIIDKIGFDFDKDKKDPTDEKCLEDIKKLHYDLKANDYEHTLVFSGRGFHCYLFTTAEKLMHPKNALKTAHNMFEKKLELTIDETIKGNIAQYFRTPGTLNLKSQRFAIFISEEDLEKGYKYIFERAKNQQSEMKIYGTKKFDLKIYDVAPIQVSVGDFKMTEYSETLDDEVLKDAPPCIVKCLLSDGDFRCRWLFSIYMHEKGFPIEVADKIAKKYFSRFKRTDRYKDNYIHMKKVKTLKYAYDGDDIFFPNCASLFAEGKCPGKCKFWPIEKRLYE